MSHLLGDLDLQPSFRQPFCSYRARLWIQRNIWL